MPASVVAHAVPFVPRLVGALELVLLLLNWIPLSAGSRETVRREVF